MFAGPERVVSGAVKGDLSMEDGRGQPHGSGRTRRATGGTGRER